jgi:hypothetical protein
MSARPTLFRTKRFAAEAAITVALVLGFFALGFWVAGTILANLPQHEGLQWVITDPSDAFAAKMKLGVTAALTPIVTLVALVLYRVGGRAHPGWRPTLIYLALPIAVVAAGIAVQVHGLHTLGRVDPAMGTPYLVAVRDVLPGFITKNLLVISTLVLWTAAFAVARTGRKASPG